MTRRISAVAVCCSSALGQRSPEAFDLGLQVIRVGPRDSAGPVERAGAFLAELRLRAILVLAPGTLHTERLPSPDRSRPARDSASRHPGRRRSSASRPFRGARAPRPYPDPASGARWAVLGRGSPWSLWGDPSAVPTSQNSRLRHAPDRYTPSWRLCPAPLEPPVESADGDAVAPPRDRALTGRLPDRLDAEPVELPPRSPGRQTRRGRNRPRGPSGGPSLARPGSVGRPDRPSLPSP